MSASKNLKKYEGEIRKAIQDRIFQLRGTAVILDFHLAEFYGVETKALNRAVKRNLKRFPDDFMYRLTKTEEDFVKSKFLTSSWGGRRHGFMVFTYKGIGMMSGLLTSSKAIQINILIVRTFDHLREMYFENKNFARRFDAIESHLVAQDDRINELADEVQLLLEEKSKSKGSFGFVGEPRVAYKATRKKPTH